MHPHYKLFPVSKRKTFNQSFGNGLTPEGKERRRLPEDSDSNRRRKQGGERRGSNGNRYAYGAVTVLEEMVHRLPIAESGEGSGTSTALLCAGSHRCWGLQ